MKEIILIEKESNSEWKEPKKLNLDNMKPLYQEIAEIENFYKDCSLDEAIGYFSDKSNECFTLIREAIFEVKAIMRLIKYIQRANIFKIEAKILGPVVESFSNEITGEDLVDDRQLRKDFIRFNMRR